MAAEEAVVVAEEVSEEAGEAKSGLAGFGPGTRWGQDPGSASAATPTGGRGRNATAARLPSQKLPAFLQVRSLMLKVILFWSIKCVLGVGFRGRGRGGVLSRIGARSSSNQGQGKLPADLVLTNITAEGPKKARARVEAPKVAMEEDDDLVVMEEEDALEKK